MMGPSILRRYVFREVATSFLFSFAVFLFAGLVAGFLPLLQKGMEAGLGLTLILFQVLINALPSTLVTVVPLSMTIGILMGLGRMASDNEIAAVKYAGVSVVKLLPPVLILGFIGFLLTLWCTLVLIPKGIQKGHEYMREAMTSRIDAAIEERTFFDHLNGLLIYAEKVDHGTRQMDNVFIRESFKPDEVKTILARKGQIVPDPAGKDLIMQLEDGTTLVENQRGEFTAAASFTTWVLRYPFTAGELNQAQKSLEESPIRDILKLIRDANAKEQTATGPQRDAYRREQTVGRVLLTQRFVHPMACIGLTLVAFPLGVLQAGRSRLNNVALGLAAVFIYYALSLSTERMARSDLATPEVILSVPPVFFVIAGVYFIRCVRLERIPFILRLFRSTVQRFRSGKI